MSYFSDHSVGEYLSVQFVVLGRTGQGLTSRLLMSGEEILEVPDERLVYQV